MTPGNQDVIVANFNGEFVCKILDSAQCLLLSANETVQAVPIHDYDIFTIEGVVIRSIRCHRPSYLLVEWDLNMYALVDANSFYCSAELVFRPEWRGKPIIVLSNNDGMVVAANRQAKETGVPKFQSYFKIKALCERKGVIALSSKYELYSDLSAKIMQVIGRFASEQHIYSIDESFLRFSRCQSMIQDFTLRGMNIRKAMWKECRLPVCVGMGPTVTLAKVANHAAKKLKQFNRVCVINNDALRREVLNKMDVADVWGIGRKLSTKLRIMKVKTALDLALLSPERARREFSVEVERTIRELNGLPCISWESARADKQQIFSTRIEPPNLEKN